MLAIAAFTVSLYEDAGIGPGELISDDTVQAGDSFYVEVVAREFDPLVAGLRGVALDIAWDPAVFQEIDDSFEPENPASQLVTQDFPLFRSGQLDNSAGTIDNLAGYAFLSGGSGRAIGNLTAERFSLLRFRALQPVEDSQLSMRQGRSSIVTVPVFGLDDADLYFEPQTITVVAATEGLLAEQPPASDHVRTVFVGPLTADEYFKSIHSEPIAHGEPAPAETIVVHECWSNEPVSNEPVLPASLVDPDAADADLPFTDETVHARASVNLPSVTRRQTASSRVPTPSDKNRLENSVTGPAKPNNLEGSVQAGSVSDGISRISASSMTLMATYHDDWAWTGPQPTRAQPIPMLRLTDVTPLDLPSTVNTETDPSTAAVDMVFAADESVELFDDVERRLKQIADGRFSSL